MNPKRFPVIARPSIDGIPTCFDRNRVRFNGYAFTAIIPNGITDGWYIGGCSIDGNGTPLSAFDRNAAAIIEKTAAVAASDFDIQILKPFDSCSSSGPRRDRITLGDDVDISCRRDVGCSLTDDTYIGGQR